jgi:hypothetical protein
MMSLSAMAFSRVGGLKNKTARCLTHVRAVIGGKKILAVTDEFDQRARITPSSSSSAAMAFDSVIMVSI